MDMCPSWEDPIACERWANVDPPKHYLEPLFLDLTVEEVATNTAWMQVVEPWATMYVDAINDGRYGDAVWARYHIAGRVVDGVIPQLGPVEVKTKTVFEVIEEDALEYWEDDPREYLKALEFYDMTKGSDGHKDVIELLVRCAKGAPVATNKEKL